MYVQFDLKEEYNFTSQYGVVDYVWNIEGLSTMAKTIYQILFAEQKKMANAMGDQKRLQEDYKGIYLELARSIIAEKVSLCAHTVAKYIKELQRFGLLVDRRMGVKRINRIYLKYRKDAKRYNTDKSENKNVQKNNDVKSANDTSYQNVTLIKKANDIIAQLTDECPEPRIVNQMLKLCKDNLEELDAAVKDCFGHTPKVSYAAMLFDRLKNKYYKKKEQKKSDCASKKSSNYTPRKKSNGHFTKVESHGFNIDNMSKREILLLEFNNGVITEEEYYTKLNMIEIYE